MAIVKKTGEFFIIDEWRRNFVRAEDGRTFLVTRILISRTELDKYYQDIPMQFKTKQVVVSKKPTGFYKIYKARMRTNPFEGLMNSTIAEHNPVLTADNIRRAILNAEFVPGRIVREGTDLGIEENQRTYVRIGDRVYTQEEYDLLRYPPALNNPFNDGLTPEERTARNNRLAGLNSGATA